MRHVGGRIVRSLFLVAALLAASTASAGYRWVLPVSIGPDEASGALASARNSASTTEYIGCGIDTTQRYSYAQCWAEDAAGATATCFIDEILSPAMYAAIAALNGDGYLRFKWNEYGDCTSVSVTNRSFFEPKSP